ncbi:MAG: LD-carboxypeptidase [Flavobacteriales bacterium]|nr:LD-carboxypeptidase [Flavobacteriales bacterium]
MRTPDYLKEGDRIAIVATARKVTKQEMQPCIYILESWGLEVVLATNLYDTKDQFAGTDQGRSADLQAMLDDKQIKAILFARGGYGTVRIVDLLDFKGFCEHPKWLIGYSDITVLHSHVNKHCKVETVHGVMAINFVKDNHGVAGLKQTLFGEPLGFELQVNKLNRAGQSQGRVVGGNLSLLYSLKGSISDAETAGKILFIEDLDEYLYHIDRMMTNLKRSGMLANLKGLIVGGMTDMNDNEIPFGKSAEEIIMDVLGAFDYPVCFGFPAGHVKRNMPLILGREVQLNVTSSGTSINYH